MTTKRPKGDIWGKSLELVKKGTASTKKWYLETGKVKVTKAGSKLARHYKKYVRPTTKIVRGVGRFARGTVKLAARFPGTGLAATGLYYAGKHIIKKGEKIAPRTAFRQYNKKGKWMV
mgnify:CR=1 FL=1